MHFIRKHQINWTDVVKGLKQRHGLYQPSDWHNQLKHYYHELSRRPEWFFDLSLWWDNGIGHHSINYWDKINHTFIDEYYAWRDVHHI